MDRIYDQATDNLFLRVLFHELIFNMLASTPGVDPSVLQNSSLKLGNNIGLK